MKWTPDECREKAREMRTLAEVAHAKIALHLHFLAGEYEEIAERLQQAYPCKAGSPA